MPFGGCEVCRRGLLTGKSTIAQINQSSIEAGRMGIACGMARYEQDRSVAEVFKRADSNMYQNKKMLKAM